MAGVYRRVLPAGWYPQDAVGVRNSISEFSSNQAVGRKSFSSCIVPHAGWFFSGKTACMVFASCVSDIRTVVVAGGHLASDSLPVFMDYEHFETPLGRISCDLDLLAYLKQNIAHSLYSVPDNTVEIQLPFIRYFFPEARIVGLRVPSSSAALELANALAAFDDKLLVVGSCDLTHYGPDYGFMKKGLSSSQARDWVADFNDRRFIDACLALDYTAILSAALEYRASCSAGAALVAARYAEKSAYGCAELVDYCTSYDIRPAESFVGYAGLRYCHDY